ncbi:MAG: class I SAM-dependent methyltransferase [Acidimicrobiales bacterium]
MSRSRSFGAVAELYDRYRPPPPEGLAEYLGPLRGLDALDVAAGTGLVTRYLESLGARVTCVEPDPQMRAVLVRRSPAARVRAGVAEDLPVDDASVDVALTSSAWHWFTQPNAAQEFARVLRDGGRLFILGNGPDREHGWLERLAEAAHAASLPTPAAATRHAAEAHEDLTDPFVDVGTFEIHWTWRRTVEELLGLLQTYSAAIVLPDEERASLVERARTELLRSAPEGVLDVAMLTHGVRATRRAR